METSSATQTSKTLTFYSPEEQAEVLRIGALEGAARKEAVKLFAERTGRQKSNVMAKYYALIKEQKHGKRSRTTNPKSSTTPHPDATTLTTNGNTITIPLKGVTVTQDTKGNWFLKAVV